MRTIARIILFAIIAACGSFILAGILSAAGTVHAAEDIPRPVRDTSYDYRCIGPDEFASNHTRLDQALYVCMTKAKENPGKTYYIQPGTYRVMVPSSEPPPPPPPVACEGTWSLYARVAGSESSCSSAGQRTFSEQRTFTITKQPANGGAACPTSPQTRTSQEACTPPVVAGEISVKVALPTENEDGTPVVQPLSVYLSYRPESGGSSVERQASLVNGSYKVSSVAPGTYRVKSRVKDGAGDFSEYSPEVRYVVAGDVVGGGSVTAMLKGKIWRKDLNGSPAARDLTFLGSLDWAYWGRSAASDFDHKSGGSIFAAVEKLTGSEGAIARSVPSGGTKYPACSWTDGTPTASNSSERDNVYITTSTAGWGIKMTTGALGSGRKRLVFGVAGYQSDMIIKGIVSDGSSSDFNSGTLSIPSTEVHSYDVSIVVEPNDPSATFTLSLEASDTDGNVGFQYAYAEDWPYEIVVEDSFTGSDNTAIEGRTPDVVSLLTDAPAGAGTTSGSYGNGVDIVSNQAKFNTASETIEYDINSYESIVEVDMVLASTSVNRNYVSLSRTDTGNLFGFNPRQADSDWNVYRRDAAVQTTLTSANAKTWGTSKTYHMEFRRVGETLRLTSDGDLLYSYTNATQHKTATKVGLGVAGQTGAGIYDNLVIWRPIYRQPVARSAADTPVVLGSILAR